MNHQKRPTADVSASTRPPRAPFPRARVMRDDVVSSSWTRDATETTTLLRADGDVDAGRAWTRGRRRTVIGVLSASLALMVALMVAGRAGRAFLSKVKPRFTVDFHVDVGCIPMEVMNLSPVKNFFSSDVASVRMLRRGNSPTREFGGVNRRAGAVELSQSGWSSVYVGSAKVREGEEIGFALVNDAGDAIFELGYNKRFPRDVLETRRRGRGGVQKSCHSEKEVLASRRRRASI